MGVSWQFRGERLEPVLAGVLQRDQGFTTASFQRRFRDRRSQITAEGTAG